MRLFTDDIPESVQATLDELYGLEEWPQDFTKDVALIERLGGLYSDLDLKAEALHYVTWFGEWREKHPRKAVNHRSRFFNWIKNANRYAGRRAKPPAKPDAHKQTGVEGW